MSGSEVIWGNPIYIHTTATVAILVMWRTPYGDRILEGAEAIVFAEALLNLLDEVTLCDFDDYELGIKCFDSLTYGQKISVLATIGNGLFRKSESA
jgi:hypothetical protein